MRICLCALFTVLLSLVVIGCGARPATITDDPGQTQASGELRGQQQSGAWQYYYDDGTLKAEGPWRRDQRHGTWHYYHADGTQQAAGDYVDGLRQGWWRHYHLGTYQAVASEGLMVDDRQHGLWLYRHNDGLIAGVGVFAAGSRILSWQRFSAQGSPTDAVILHRGERVSVAADDQGCWQHGDDESWIAGDGDGLVLSQDDQGGWLQYTTDPHTVTVLRLNTDGAVRQFWRLADDRLRTSGTPDGVDQLEAETLLQRAAALRQALEAESPQRAEMPLAPLVLWPDTEDIEVSPAPSVGLGGLSLLEEQRLQTAQQVYSGEGSFDNASSRPSMPGRRTYGSAPSQEPRDHGLVGRSLPQRRFIQADGSVLDLSRREGIQLIVILRGFAGNICPYCGGQSKALLAHQEAIAQHGADLTFIYPGSSASLPDFLRAVRSLDEEPLPPFTVALDVDLQLVETLDIGAELALPTSLLVDSAGVIRYAYVGKDLMDRPTVPDILAALSQLAEDE